MVHVICFFFFKQKPAYEMRISDWSSDVCSSDLAAAIFAGASEKVRERRQFLERGKLVDHAIETALLIGFQAHDRADRDIEPHGDQGTERRKLVGLHGNEEPAVVPLGRDPVADRKPVVGIVKLGERSEERRVGKECVSTGRSGWSPDQLKKNKNK